MRASEEELYSNFVYEAVAFFANKLIAKKYQSR